MSKYSLVSLVGIALVFAALFCWPRAVGAPVVRRATATPTQARAVAELPKVTAAAAPMPVQVASLRATPSGPPELDEPSLMAKLRELADSNPEYSLGLARTGNKRFADSSEAAEREWYICKALVNLQDFYGAREEARLMVTRYPGTPWSLDVQRHLLTNPLELPGDPQVEH